MRVTILRTDGTEAETTVDGGNAMNAIRRLIDARGLDVVNLRDGRVMVVDDYGYETEEESTVVDGALYVHLTAKKARKPVNAKATTLYHGVCKPGTTHQIVGDVVIARDDDFR